MIKKFLTLLLISILIIACGKKSAPLYEEQEQNTKVFSTKLNIIS
jgi:hypothetical protein|tara:strand:+ start:166 stop:300 length:135 start_codon:yes stop_codon:yes gene_type:complete